MTSAKIRVNSMRFNDISLRRQLVATSELRQRHEEERKPIVAEMRYVRCIEKPKRLWWYLCADALVGYEQFYCSTLLSRADIILG